MSLLPTLIFTLVLAGILRERFRIDDVVFGALLVYAAVTTILPSLVFRMPFDVDPAQDTAVATEEADPVPEPAPAALPEPDQAGA